MDDRDENAVSPPGDASKPPTGGDVFRPGNVRGKARGKHPLIERMKKNSGRLKSLWETIRAEHPGDPLRQSSEWWQSGKHYACTGETRRRNGVDTLRDLQKRMDSCYRDLRKMNIRLQNWDQLSTKQVGLLVRFWEERGLTASTMQNKLTALRRFCIDIGKPNTVPELQSMLQDPMRGYRSGVAWEGKSMEAKQVDPFRVFAEADALCEVFGMQLRLMYWLGARDQEAIQFRPLLADTLGGAKILLSFGTKGGRSRAVDVRTPEQRAVIERCKDLAKGNPKGYMGSIRKLKAAKSRFYRLLREIGMTKRELGVTAYAMRHSFANNEYKAVAGVESPVMGGPTLSKEERDVVETAVAASTGHVRKSVNAFYNGTNRTMTKAQRWRCERLLEWFDDSRVRQELEAAGITCLKVLGADADGQPLGGTVLFGFEAAGADLTPEQYEKVRALTASVLTAGTRLTHGVFLVAMTDARAQGLSTLEVF